MIRIIRLLIGVLLKELTEEQEQEQGSFGLLKIGDLTLLE